MPEQPDFLKQPGLPGPFGALMDECARAAADFCRVVEAIPPERFLRERASDDPNTVSIRAVCAHVVGAVHRHADYIRKAHGEPVGDPFKFDPARLGSPRDVRGHLAEQLQYAEETVLSLRDLPEESIAALTFTVRWGPTYDPEMMMEHALVHLLRHRRQIERWEKS